MTAFNRDNGEDICFAYNEDNDEETSEWKCNSEFEARGTKTRDVAWTRTSRVWFSLVKKKSLGVAVVAIVVSFRYGCQSGLRNWLLLF